MPALILMFTLSPHTQHRRMRHPKTVLGYIACPTRPAAVLAEDILRFQRVDREEAEREARVHARESGAAKTGATSEGLALEQLGILSKWRLRVGED